MKNWVLSFMALTGVIQGAPPNTFHFREPRSMGYRVETEERGASWITAVPEHSPTNRVQFGSRIVLQFEKSARLPDLLAKRPLSVARRVTDQVVILEAPDAMTAAREADALGRKPGVVSCHPVMRRESELDAAYARQPNDPWFYVQTYLENRYPDGPRYAADLNVLSAWPVTRGSGVTIAIADDGVETSHPEFISRTVGAPHYNFEIDQPNGEPPTTNALHGTCVAGFAVAAGNNGIGISGIAPEARMASWVIVGTNTSLGSRQYLVDDESLMDMFQYQSNVVQVQNHSWAWQTPALFGIGPLLEVGISNAVTFGRNGLGTVIVRSGGNHREGGHNANDNAIRSDPRFVAVAAANFNGRVASYSNPGACLLVAGFGDEFNYMLTTDLTGPAGNSRFQAFSDPNFWDYFLGFKGTSAAAPQVSGIAALILSANPSLSYRDVQQILIHSAQHFDLADPGLTTNGAGFRVSHNLGFGIPDAGHAARLAKSWPSRPAMTNLFTNQTFSTTIPDAGLRVVIPGENVPTNIASLAAAPGQGPHADDPTPILPLVDVGAVTGPVALNLTNKAALIQHSSSQSFASEITRVAQAGAAFAVLFHTSDTNVPSVMTGTYFAPIPAVLIGQTRGLAIREYIQTNGAGSAQIVLNAADYTFHVPQTLSCEHVGVRVSLSHPVRADLRITVTSPQGTRSVLQQANGDISAAPTNWTYWTTHHFHESSAGAWRVSVSDEFPGGTGTVESIALLVRGAPISDSDADGLDDNWEVGQFGNLAALPTADPDLDGYNNVREQILGTNPLQGNAPLELDLSRWKTTIARSSWPSSTNFNYEVWSGTNISSLNLATNMVGQFPETEWFVANTNAQQFIRVKALPR